MFLIKKCFDQKDFLDIWIIIWLLLYRYNNLDIIYKIYVLKFMYSLLSMIIVYIYILCDKSNFHI